MLNIEKIPDLLGYLILTDDGAVVASGGELENDEHVADVISGLVSLADKIDPIGFPDENFKKISITYGDHAYIICLSNKKIHVVKRNFVPHQNDIVTA